MIAPAGLIFQNLGKKRMCYRIIRKGFRAQFSGLFQVLKVTTERLLLTALSSTFSPNGVEMSATRGVFGLGYFLFVCVCVWSLTKTRSDPFTVTVGEKWNSKEIPLLSSSPRHLTATWYSQRSRNARQRNLELTRTVQILWLRMGAGLTRGPWDKYECKCEHSLQFVVHKIK